MYAMWWHKPLAPKEPFILKGDWVKPLCAYMYMSSEMSGEEDEKSIGSQTVVKKLFAFLHLYSKVPEIESMSLRPKALTSATNAVDMAGNASSETLLDSNLYNSSNDGPSHSGALTLASKACLCKLRSKKLEKAAGTAFFERRPRVKALDIDSSTIPQTTINRWALASAAIENCPAIRENHLFHSHNQDRCFHFRSEELVVPRVQNWPLDDLLRNVDGLVVGMVLWLACLAYGAVHLSAWNNHFPTEVEKWLWRLSSLYRLLRRAVDHP